jgi:hypothetical protein
MTELKNIDTDTVITPFVSLKEKQEVIRILHKTLDGNQRCSRFGQPIISYDLIVFVKYEGKIMLMSCEDELSLLRVTLKSKTYFGRIIELGEFERISDEYFKTEMTLAKESE